MLHSRLGADGPSQLLCPLLPRLRVEEANQATNIIPLRFVLEFWSTLWMIELQGSDYLLFLSFQYIQMHHELFVFFNHLCALELLLYGKSEAVGERFNADNFSLATEKLTKRSLKLSLINLPFYLLQLYFPTAASMKVGIFLFPFQP